MTVREAVERADALFPNVLPFARKAEWLRELDMKVFTEFISFYEGQEKNMPEDFYSPDTKLLISEPFSEVYIRYICLQTDIANGDSAGYKNSAALFNSSYLAFMNHFNRTHLVKTQKITVSGG